MKKQVAFRVDDAIIKRLRNAVHHARGAPMFLTLDGFVASTLDKATRVLEVKHNGGKPFAEPRAK